MKLVQFAGTIQFDQHNIEVNNARRESFFENSNLKLGWLDISKPYHCQQFEALVFSFKMAT